MKAFKEFMTEVLEKSIINRAKKQVDIHKNPSRSTLNKDCSYIEKWQDKPTGNRESGVFLHGDDLHAFGRYDMLHGEVAPHINAGKDHLPIHLYHNGGHAHAQVTNASRGTNWHHNPRADDYIMNHPQLTKHFKHIEVSHWDDDVHDWHGDHSDDHDES